MPMALQDPGQIVKYVYDEANEAIKVNLVEGTLSEQAIGQPGVVAPADVKVAGGVDGSGNARALHTDTSGDLQVDILTSALPTGAATEATLSALSAKSASSDVTVAYDYTELSYITSGNGTGEIGTVIYKTGGSGGTTVATRTLAYDGSNRLISVTKS